MEPLAIHGGTPVRATPIHYGRQSVDESDCEAVREVLLSDFLTTGPKTAALEEALCRLAGARHAVAVSSGTAALHAALHVAGIQPGDEVITTPLTFSATANSVLYCGGTPVFADVDPATFCLSPAAVLERVTPRTRAVIAVDYAGQAAQYDELHEICDRRGLLLIGDAAHSIGTKYKGRPVGSLADLTTFSFHPVKTVTGGEGGAVLTNSGEYARALRRFRSHGVTRDRDEMAADEGPWFYEQTELGFNYRVSDIQAALALSQLARLDRFAARRAAIVKRYDEAFSPLPELFLQQEIPQSDTVRHLYVLGLRLERLRCSRREFFDAMAAENVVPNVHYIPVYYHPYYEGLGYRRGLCPKAEALYERIITIPLFYSMTGEDVDSVIAATKKVLAAYRKA